MAIDTINEKLAIMEFGDVWEPGLPMVATDTIDQADQQQLLLGFPGVLWAVLEFIAGAFINERLFAFLFPTYNERSLESMVNQDLSGRTGSQTERFLALIAEANAAF